jgi:hypothetical protein
MILFLHVNVGSGLEHLTELLDLIPTSVQMVYALDTIGFNGPDRLVIVSFLFKLILLALEYI